MTFAHAGDSHTHSLETLSMLYEYDDFMFSIRSVLDLGCGSGDDLLWWATRTTRDESPMPLNIACTGVDINSAIPQRTNTPNVKYQICDFEGDITPYPKGYDILWCHDSFQYATDPLGTLSRWWHLASPGGMLCITVPLTQQIRKRQLNYYLHNGVYYHHTVVSLIYMLATAGWDCKSGFFKLSLQDNWISACVYKSQIEPMNPKTTSWYALSELKLLPDSADSSIQNNGFLQQQDLVLPWLDHSLCWLANI